MDDAVPPEVVECVWTDAWGDTDQHSPEIWRENFPVHSVGFLVRDEEAVVSLAAEILPDGDYRGVLHIPRQLMVSCRRLVKEVDV